MGLKNRFATTRGKPSKKEPKGGKGGRAGGAGAGASASAAAAGSKGGGNDAAVPASLAAVVAGSAAAGEEGADVKAPRRGGSGKTEERSKARKDKRKTEKAAITAALLASAGGTASARPYVVDPAYEAQRKEMATTADDTESLLRYEPSPDADTAAGFSPGPGFGWPEYRELVETTRQVAAARRESAGGGAGGGGAREATPEIVVVGSLGVGKSSLVEALLGLPLNHTGFDDGASRGTTRRVTAFRVSNAAEGDVSLSYTLPPDRRPVRVADASALVAALEKLHNVPSHVREKVEVNVSMPEALNMKLIDTPGLNPSPDADAADTNLTETLVLDAMRPPHRLIICVEEAAPRERVPARVRELVRLADPTGARTVFVQNKVLQHLEDRCGADAAVRATWFTHQVKLATQRGCPTFFVTLLNDKERAAAITAGGASEFAARTARLEARQAATLDQAAAPALLCGSHAGVTNLRTHVVEWAWRVVRERSVPLVRGALSDKAVGCAELAEDLAETVSNLDLRELAAHLGVRFVQLAQALLRGSARANADADGEELFEERDGALAGGAWDADERDVPFAAARILGGAQFERLFSDFEASLATVTLDAAEIDLGAPGHDDKKYAMHACDVVHTRLQELVLPLLEGLVDRCAYVMNRVPRAVESILEDDARTREDAGYLPAGGVRHELLAPFITYVADRFESFVTARAADTKARCAADIFEAKTIYWHAMEIKKIPVDKVPANFVQAIFDAQTARLLAAARRKIYAFFLRPFLADPVWVDVQAHVMCMDKETLEEIFDISSIEDILEHEQAEAQAEAAETQATLDTFNTNVAALG